MKFYLLYLGMAVVFSLAVPVTAFSRGAGPASCKRMNPGHIRAQPQDPQQSHVTIRTSVRSYLPGQLITVTVRSSRDFMGFLLQARGGQDSRALGGEGGGAGSPEKGPVLVGGSWTLTPPGTHTLHCLSEGDTLTHSDKQLKRNLSFVWRAPDAPVGDVRFYITVVQSYFVYWAGIKSPVVRDGSLWTGRNTTGDETRRLHEDKLTMMSDNQITRPSLRPPKGTLSSTSKEVWSSTGTRGALTGDDSDHGNNSILGNSSRSLSGDNHATFGSMPEKESGSGRGSPVTFKDPSFSLYLLDHLPFRTSFPPAEDVKTFSTSTPPFLLDSLNLWKDGKVSTDIETRTSTVNPQKPSQHLAFHISPSVPTSRLFTFETQSSSSSPVKGGLSTYDLRGRGGSQMLRTMLLSNTSIHTTSPTQPLSHSRSVLPNHVQSLLMSRSNSTDTPRPPSPQTLLQMFLPQRQEQVSLSPKYPVMSEKSADPQARPRSLQTEESYARMLNALLFTTKADVHKDASISPSTTLKTTSPIYSSVSSLHSSSLQSSLGLTTPLHLSQDSSKRLSFTRSSSQQKTSPGFSALQKPSPISTPPESVSVHVSSTFPVVSPSLSSTFPSSSSNSPSSATSDSHFPLNSIPGITGSASSSTQTLSSLSSSSAKSSLPSSPHPSFSVFSSVGFLSFISPTSLHPGPSPAPRRSHYNRVTVPLSLSPSPRQMLLIQTHVASTHPELIHNPSTPDAVAESERKPKTKFKLNIRDEFKPKPPMRDAKLPSNPSETPGKDGKYPEVVSRHSSWELGMLLGCSAGLGMVLVVGVRYVYRQACGKRTEVTLNDRDRDYRRGDQGMIHVQECGDLVRVRRIRENSLVLLAEYDILASSGD
ncbi:mucin-2-like [Dunckerocampus dactyliophorus]|uniref:mucin-2-like n=1 Tax=Dunckerocampus dactyliophorus TaxID=161453 RepID=UPI002404F206|nr:mucin-2-like [Dunckerocampus dactyliophorus]